MALTEFYVKLVIGFPRDPKVRALVRLGSDAGLARDLYVQMLLYCKENLSDGFVPVEEVGVLAYPLPVDQAEQLAKQLASVGLTKLVSKNEAEFWEVLAYVRRNGTREDVERLSAVRAEAGRAGDTKSRKTTKPAGHKPEQASGKQVGKQTGKQNGSKHNPETESSSSSRPSSDVHAELSAAVSGGVTEEETELVIALVGARPEVRDAAAVTRAEIRKGNGPALVAQVRHSGPSAPHRDRPPHCGDSECNPATRRREDIDGADDGPCPKCAPRTLP